MAKSSKSIPVGTQPADISIRTLSKYNASYSMETLLNAPAELVSGEEIDSIAKKFSHIIKIHPSSDGTHPTWTGRWWLTLREEKELKEWASEFSSQTSDF